MAATKALELAQLANTIDVNTSGEITNIGTLSSIATTGNATFGANATFADNGKAIFGAGSDLQIYHDGSNSYIDEVGTGSLRIRGYNQVRITDTSDNIAAIFKGDAESTLYHNNSPKLTTTSTGIDVTGTINTDDLVVSGNLTVSGTMTSINSDNLEIEDLNITLANGAADSTAASGAGITVDGASATLIYTHDATNPGWSVNKAFGVGVTTPEKPFHVKDDVNQLAIFESTDGRASIELRDTVDSAFLITESNKFAIHPSSSIGNNGLVMNLSTGKVGIGTDDPTMYLDIKGSDNSQLRLEGTDTNPTTVMMDYNSTGSTDRVRIQNDAGDLKFTTSNGQIRQTLLKTGNVGIGTESPNANLEINYTHNTNYDGYDSIGWNTWDGAGLLIKNSSNDSTNNYTSLGFFTGGGSGNFSARIATVVGSSGSGYMSFLLRSNSHTSHVNEKLRIDHTGDVLPGVDNTQDLGSTSKRWANVYTGDLHLSNEGSKNDIDGTSGNWTVQEGEDHLYIINNKSGKKYRFALEEIE